MNGYGSVSNSGTQPQPSQERYCKYSAEAMQCDLIGASNARQRRSRVSQNLQRIMFLI